MSNRTFEHFPKSPEIKCPICGKNEDKECFLVPIDGTAEDDGKICQAKPVHVACVTEQLDQFRFLPSGTSLSVTEVFHGDLIYSILPFEDDEKRKCDE